jgi:beta-glucosidase
LIHNSGNFDGDEVVQLYVSYPNSKVERPIIALKGFKRIFVPKGQSIALSIPLNTEELKYWDVEKQNFVLENGSVDLLLGTSSANIVLKGSLIIQ